MSCPFNWFLRDSAATTSIEYSLIAAVIALGLIAVVWHLGDSVARMYAGIGTAALGG